jgi:hypothetical protein
MHYLSFLVRLVSFLSISSSKVILLGSLHTHPRPYNMSALGIKKEEIKTIKRKQA